MNKERLKKIKLILEIIRKRQKGKSIKNTVEFEWNDFMRFPPLNDKIGLEQLFKRIQKETKENLILKLPTQDQLFSPSRFGDTTFNTTLYRYFKNMFWIHVENFEGLEKYYKDISQQLKGGEKVPILLLNSEGELYKTDDKERKRMYPMNPKGLRYKIVHYLATEKCYTQTTELGIEFEKTSQEIRKTIEQIRRQIERLLNIPGDRVIENKRGSGYRIKIIKLKEN